MLRVQTLTKRSEGTTILDQVSFHAKEGEITAILGPSGAGKTTLFRCLAQLEKPDGGVISFDHRDLSSLSHGEIGLVFQSFHLFPHLTVLQNLTLAPMGRGVSRTESEAKAYQLLDQFAIGDKANVHPNQLSGGQKQRVAIARALMLDPPILLFDEPTSALDPEMVKDVADIIRRLKSPGRVILLITHEIRLARSVADHILFLSAGKILDDYPANSFFIPENLSLLSNRAQSFLENLA